MTDLTPETLREWAYSLREHAALLTATYGPENPHIMEYSGPADILDGLAALQERGDLLIKTSEGSWFAFVQGPIRTIEETTPAAALIALGKETRND